MPFRWFWVKCGTHVGNHLFGDVEKPIKTQSILVCRGDFHVLDDLRFAVGKVRAASLAVGIQDDSDPVGAPTLSAAILLDARFEALCTCTRAGAPLEDP